ncbi:LytTR family DNA-binding domain-containing protein [Tenacibaculum sp. 47A_GOM-205m]|uniref:LytR/AlgR family response regulator transcription factor n=1 Tax=Tenacibaculum sp. 47A_GOM-205m TaxID=1380384 RepID=UPI00048D6C51|nr:LytTR family DNA-binding domain-containing protein [Tenacibaculum sp. 47A_GOM-205m]
MIKALIVEDELPARKKLKKYIESYHEPITVVDEFETVEEVLQFFESTSDIDLIFSDIELRDGNVFDAYNKLQIQVPIIFITAYNQFWMHAFETSGIEYLLKPYSFERFEKAVNKYSNLKSSMKDESNHNVLQKLDAYLANQTAQTPKSYQDFIAVKSSQYTYFLKMEEVMYFQADYGIVTAYDINNKKHVLNQSSLKALEEIINPSVFFKINRGELLNRNYIEKISRYNKNVVAINLKNSKTVLKTSQNKTAEFTKWLGV